MSVLKRKSRMISFRLSEDEYTGLRNLCIHEGARSVSDLARDAVHRLIDHHPAPNNHLETTVQVLQVKIEALDLEVKRLTMVLDGQLHGLGTAAGKASGDD